MFEERERQKAIMTTIITHNDYIKQQQAYVTDQRNIDHGPKKGSNDETIFQVGICNPKKKSRYFIITPIFRNGQTIASKQNKYCYE